MGHPIAPGLGSLGCTPRGGTSTSILLTSFGFQMFATPPRWGGECDDISDSLFVHRNCVVCCLFVSKVFCYIECWGRILRVWGRILRVWGGFLEAWGEIPEFYRDWGGILRVWGGILEVWGGIQGSGVEF